jgi:hypothetical protein
MFGLKLHLDPAEHAVVSRFADSLQVKPEDIVYAALNRLMLDAHNPEIHTDIRETKDWRQENLPLWADTARSVHAYEGKGDDHPEEHTKF